MTKLCIDCAHFERTGFGRECKRPALGRRSLIDGDRQKDGFTFAEHERHWGWGLPWSRHCGTLGKFFQPKEAAHDVEEEMDRQARVHPRRFYTKEEFQARWPDMRCCDKTDEQRRCIGEGEPWPLAVRPI